jgi:uncharacterized damage-inducible protein DinB
MQLIDHVRQMAEYNHWMNQKLYDACEKLSVDQLSENRGAFFGSVLGTLNHIMVADTIWLKRFAAAGVCSLEVMDAIPYPESLDAVLFNKLPELRARREHLDQVILAFGSLATEEALQAVISYKSLKGVAFNKIFFNLLMHVFNHQTHHRGQISTLLSQVGIDIGVTDLAALIPDV